MINYTDSIEKSKDSDGNYLTQPTDTNDVLHSDSVVHLLDSVGEKPVKPPPYFSGVFDKNRMLKLARTTEGNSKNTALIKWSPTVMEFCDTVSDTEVGAKDGPYLVRAPGIKRSDKDLSDHSDVLIIDGDSKLSGSGEVLDGCAHPETVVVLLTQLGIPFAIYMSHSNGAKGATYHKWRLIIFVSYHRDQLEALLDWVFNLLHSHSIMVAPVKENKTWSQAWYFSRAIDEGRALEAVMSYQENLAGYEINADFIYDEWLRRKSESATEVKPITGSTERPEGFRSPIDEFNRTHGVSDLLVSEGYEQTAKDRYLHPNSSSGIAGLVILRDKDTGMEYAYSHAGDSLNDGKRHDAFDLLVKFKYNGDFNAALNWNPEITEHNQGLLNHHNELSVINSFETIGTFSIQTLSICDARDGTENTRPLTETGNVLRFLDHHQDAVRFIVGTKNSWLVWKGNAWVLSLDGADVTELMTGIAGGVYLEASEHPRDAGYFASWARTSQKKTTINNTISLLSSKSEIRVPLAHIDSNPYLIGFDHAKKVIDLKSGVARDAIQDDLITKSLNVNYMGNAEKAIRWRQFLDQVFNGDQSLISWLKRYLGYLLTGDVNEQIFVFGYGFGANGKSALSEILQYIMGDYSRSVAPETIGECKRSAGAAAPDLITLLGARLAISAETQDGLALNESLIKLMTGGDTITARALYQSPVEFKPQFKLIIFGNHKPIIKGTDHGIWRRIRLLPFTQRFEGVNIDPRLKVTLESEAPHILAWMVEGCLEWQKIGLAGIPKVIEDATEDYRTEQDLVGHWLDECCILDDSKSITINEAYMCYTQWAQASGLKPCSKIALNRRLEERGFEKGRTSHARVWFGFELNQGATWDSMVSEARVSAMF